LAGEKVSVQFVIHEAADASLWADVPQLGIRGWTWCVGGGHTLEDHAKAIEKLGRHVQTFCDAVTYGMIEAKDGIWKLTRQVHEQGFELVETNMSAVG